jgi:succinoglycan biosynthesis transport protein ExoP
LSVAAEAYDAVIIDGPPVMGISDAALLSNLVAGTLIVIAAGEVPQAEVEQALERLELVRANVLGVLLTKFDARSASYHYYRRSPFDQGTPYGRNGTPLLVGQAKAANKITAAA